MDRKTKTITTPSGHKIEIKTYITGRELEDLDDISYKMARANQLKGKDLGEENESYMKQKLHKSIEIVVISVNNKKENILDTILDMKQSDYSFVINKITNVIKGEGEELSGEVKKNNTKED